MADVQDPQATGDDPGANSAVETGNSGDTGETGATTESQQTPHQSDGQSAGGNQGQGEAGTPKWIYQLPGDLQKDERLTSFTKPEELAKAYLDYAGKADRLVEIPEGEDADFSEVYGRLGRPELPDGYDFSMYKLPDAIDDQEIGDFRKLAHEAGLTQRQAQLILEHSLQDVEKIVQGTEQQKQEETQRKQAEKLAKIEALKKEYGDNFEEVVKKAHRAFEAVGGKEFGEHLDSTGMGDDPVMVKAFLQIADKIGDDTLFSGTRDAGTPDNWYPNTNFDG